jgi:hypothetical protein
MWVLPLVVAAVGCLMLAVLALRVRSELDPTRRSIDRFGKEFRPVLLRVRDETERTRRRFDTER